MRGRRAIALVLGAVLLAACSGDGGRSSITAAIARDRGFDVVGALELTLSKKTFTFAFEFTIDGGEPVRLELRAAEGSVLDAMRQAIDACVAARDVVSPYRLPIGV